MEFRQDFFRSSSFDINLSCLRIFFKITPFDLDGDLYSPSNLLPLGMQGLLRYFFPHIYKIGLHGADMDLNLSPCIHLEKEYVEKSIGLRSG